MVRKVVAGFAFVAMCCGPETRWDARQRSNASNRVVSSNANINVQSMAGKLLLLEFGATKLRSTSSMSTRRLLPAATAAGTLIPTRGSSSWSRNDNDRGDGGCYVDPQARSSSKGPGHIHNASNRTGTPVILDAYFFLPEFDPPGANSRIDEPVQYVIADRFAIATASDSTWTLGDEGPFSCVMRRARRGRGWHGGGRALRASGIPRRRGRGPARRRRRPGAGGGWRRRSGR